jgi:putative ABC transport system permease protein
MLFRDIVAPGRARVRPGVAGTIALAGIALAALAVIGAADVRLAAGFVAGALIALLVFAGAGRLVMRLARAVAKRVGPSQTGIGRSALPLRIALSSLHRPGAPTTGVILSLGLGLTVLVAIALVQANLSHEIDERLPQTAPTFFFIDIPAGQGAGFEKAVVQAGGTIARRAPMVRGRIVKIAGVPVDKAKIAPDVQWAARGDRGLTTAATQPSDARVVAGAWWPADYSGPPLVSLDANIAKGFGVGLGDTVTVNVLGRDIEAKIANLREIDWSNLSMNFTFVMTPNALAGAPYSDIASVFAPPGDELKVERAAAAAAPSASAIRVKEALAEVKGIMAGAGTAIRIAAAVTLLAGALVLAGAIAAGRQRRMRETVIFKVLGARRADLLAALAIEYLLLGLSAAAVAAVLGSGAARELVIALLKMKWAFLAGPVAVTALGAVAAVLILGLALTAKTLAARAARELRHE